MEEKERLSYILQLRILENIEPDNQIYRHLRIALENGYELHYRELFSTFLNSTLSIDNCRLVLDILEMYRGIIFSANIFQMPTENYKFPGFDGNDELEAKMMSYTEYFLIELGRYEEIRNLSHDNFNSHCPMLEAYKARLKYWKELPTSIQYMMSKEQLKRLLSIWR